MNHKDDRLIASGARFVETGFEALAGAAEGAERVAERNGPVDTDDDAAPLQGRAPAKRGLDDPGQPVRFTDRLMVFKSFGFEPDGIEAGPQVIFADQSEVE